jgi:hypothetical protein
MRGRVEFREPVSTAVKSGSLVEAHRAKGRVLSASLGVLAWFVAAAISFALYAGQFRTAYELQAHGRTTIGLVTSVSPRDYAGCTVRYKVASRSFSFFTVGCPSGVRPGWRLSVVYLPSDPAFSKLPGTVSPVQQGIFFVVLVCTVFALVVASVTYKIRNRGRG